jgi:hypothetical protein
VQTNPPPATRSRIPLHAFEVADQQQPEVAARRQAGAAVVRIESVAESFDVAIEVVLLKD